MDIMWPILIFLKNESLVEIKTPVENKWQRTIQLSDFFQHSLVLIPKQKRLVGAKLICCGESGASSIITVNMMKQLAWGI